MIIVDYCLIVLSNLVQSQLPQCITRADSSSSPFRTHKISTYFSSARSPYQPQSRRLGYPLHRVFYFYVVSMSWFSVQPFSPMLSISFSSVLEYNILFIIYVARWIKCSVLCLILSRIYSYILCSVPYQS